MSSLRASPFHRALHRANLVMGGEREPVLTALLIFVSVPIAAQNIPSVIMSGIALPLCIIGLRMMAKADPHMSMIYIRQRNYAVYYPPRSRPFRVDNR